MIRRGARLAGWVTGLVGTLAVLVWMERLEWLKVDWSDPLEWLVASDLEVVLAAAGRLLALALCGWLILSTVVYVFARLLGADRERVGWLAIGPIRRAVEAALAASMVVNTAVPAMAAGDPAPAAPVETAETLTAETLTAVDPSYIPVPAGPDATRPEPAEDPAPPPTDESKGPTEVVVTAGDHLWKLAAERVGQSLGSEPTDGDIAPYWARVVEANRDRLRSGDPDLIFPGEVVVLPELEG